LAKSSVVLALIYTATSRLSWVIVGVFFFTIGATAACYLFAHVQTRVHVWLDPTADYAGSGYQVSQSLFGLGTGCMVGAGLGAGRPMLVPVANAILTPYLILVGRGLKAATACRDPFGTLLATGQSVTIAWQVFIVVGGISNLIPETGLATRSCPTAGRPCWRTTCSSHCS
jgi:cell division protein FtsW (lipid II flippase)